MHNAKLTLVALGLVLSAACKDTPPAPPPPPGPPKLVEISPVSRSGFANTVVAPAVVVAVQDGSGKPLAGQSVLFTIAAGDGSLTGTTTVTTDANGQAAAPSWRLGKSANGPSGQVLRATSDTLDPLDITATVTSGYSITVRFFDADSMSAAQRALFTLAAQRIQGIITGDMADVALNNQDISGCVANQPALTETIDDLVIYATIKPIDGAGKILASAGPCFVRQPGNTPILGVMSFDLADINSLSGNGSLQEVITHEMLHVVGLGSLWGSCSVCRNFIDGAGTIDPQYNASLARVGCVATGGTVSCATKVPAEGCAGRPTCAPDPNDPGKGAGTRDSHWREATFDSELMTGFINVSPNPISAMTIGGLADLGYTVNNAANDAYTIAAGSIMASNLRSPAPVLRSMAPGWEHLNSVPLYSIDAAGTVRLVRKAQ
ncbi:MAG: leishmanolysin-related zinc metalloendopeptidase [Gemmatimonadota bacterium]